MYHCLDDDDEKTVVTENWSRDDNMEPKADISDDYSIKSDVEYMKSNPVKFFLPTRSNAWKQTIKKGKL